MPRWIVSTLLVTLLSGCGPQLRASWHLGEKPVSDAESEGQKCAWGDAIPKEKPRPPVYLTLTNLERREITLHYVTVNGCELKLGGAGWTLAPGQIRVIDLGPFKCRLPLVVEFGDGSAWRHRVRSIPWVASAPAEQVEGWCQ